MEKVEIGNATLYLADCMEVLPTLPRCDAVITDPPYGIGFQYESSYSDKFESDSHYFAMLKAVFGLCAPAQIAWFWPARRVADAANVLPPGYYVHHVAAWYRIEYAGDRYAKGHPAYTWEPIFWAAFGKANYHGPMGGNDGRDMIPSLAAHRENPKSGHPCPKPSDPFKRVTGWLSPEGGTVLDPFMGSGTAGVAAVQRGRKFIGIEIEPKYFDIACRRIEQAQQQADLFIQPAHQPAEQVSLL